jgi:signal transduction histidine kinase
MPADSHPIRKDLELIVEQADRCKNIVGGLLNFARKNQVKLEKTDLNEFVKRSISSIIHNGDIKINFETTLADPIVTIDRDQMMQVLTNLEKNAVEAMPEGGTLSISLTGDDSTVELNVKDTGVGIPKENMGVLFTTFFTTIKIGQGTGLGLPLIYGIVKMHKGQISVESNTDPEAGSTGTNFKIVLPRKREL